MPGAIRVAVDIGGTFTDLVLLEDDRVAASAKVRTTVGDPEVGVGNGVRRLLEDRDSQSVVEVVHGTTLVSNSLIERKGVTTALVATEGFRDVLESRREQRYELYDLFLEMPEPLVPRRRRLGVAGRVLADGAVAVPLDEQGVRRMAQALRDAGIEAVAISLLHAYRNPEHERRAAEILREELGDGAMLSLSSEVCPEIGEYHRTSTTVANAYVLPIVAGYLAKLGEVLEQLGVRAPLHIMLSTGGLASVETAGRFPVRLLESGPAGGVLSAAYSGSAAGYEEILAFDMGGTTAKAGLIEDGRPLIAPEHEAARVYRFVKGSGLPIRVPVIDLIEIGAGGGSIARVGPFGLPKVGPDSTGAEPGPACYGNGGTDPTVTDADLLLGYLNPDFFLGGELALDLQAARRSVAGLAAELGLEEGEAAAAVHQVVNENMASAARMHAIERGRDLRDYILVATGGAGPVHAWGVARALGIRQLLYPSRAGVASAFGMLTAPAAFEFARSRPETVSGIDWDEVRGVIDGMADEGWEQLRALGLSREDLHVELSADVRYEGQGDALTVPLGTGLRDDPAAQVVEQFEAAYLQLYGSAPPDVHVEVLTWRLSVRGPLSEPRQQAPTVVGADALKGTRPMWFAEAGGFTEGKVYDRYGLRPGEVVEGPAVVEERESTVVIGPGGTAVLDESGSLEVKIRG